MKLDKPCESCLKNNKITYSVIYKGLQEGLSYDLKLYNCTVCKTTIGIKTNKNKKQAG